MRVLIVEDDIDMAALLQQCLAGLNPPVDTFVARSRSSGIDALRREEFDFIICDLRLPPNDGGLDTAEAHGLAVQGMATQVCPGTPCLFFTGFGRSQPVLDQLSSGPTHDILGTGDPFAMTQFLPKDRFMDCVNRIRNFNTELATLDGIAVDPTGTDFVLDENEQRALRLLARPLGGTNIGASALGGLSGAQTLKTIIKNDQGHILATYFVKIGSRADMEKERQNNNRYVSTLLAMGKFPSLIRAIEAGIGTREALVYQLAEQYQESLFDVLARCESDAITIIQDVRSIFAPWAQPAHRKVFRVGEFRALRIGDSEFQKFRSAIGATQPFEEIQEELAICCQHGDLHGLNILCDGSGNAAIIDFGNVGFAPSCVDPIVLEMSILFHKDSPFQSYSWPTNKQSEAWFDLETYLLGCPVPDFVRTCREWAEEASPPGELPSVVYAEAVRQLKYKDTNHGRAVGIARAAIRART